MKTLVVEDDLTSRLLLQAILGVYGECDAAVDGIDPVATLLAAQRTKKHGDKHNPDLFPWIAAVLQGRNDSLEYDALEIALAGHGFGQDLLVVARQNRARLE